MTTEEVPGVSPSVCISVESDSSHLATECSFHLYKVDLGIHGLSECKYMYFLFTRFTGPEKEENFVRLHFNFLLKTEVTKK